MNVLIVGHRGEVGAAWFRLAGERHTVGGIDLNDENVPFERCDVMHICIPYSDRLPGIVEEYVKRYRPKAVSVDSTVVVGTTEELRKRLPDDVLLVHSPVRGTHPDLYDGLKKFVKFVGPTTPEAGRFFREYLEGYGLRVEVLSSSRASELAKILSTTYYGVLIAWHQEMKRICDEAGVDFDEAVTRFSRTTNEFVPRPQMFPGFIGGHCVMPNIELLYRTTSNTLFIDAVKKSNALTGEQEGK